jgi:hypothetical protein
MKKLLFSGLLSVAMLLSIFAFGQGRSKSSGRTVYPGQTHTTSHGGKYPGETNTQTHKGGHYQNPKTNDHYGVHKTKR